MTGSGCDSKSGMDAAGSGVQLEVPSQSSCFNHYLMFRDCSSGNVELLQVHVHVLFNFNMNVMSSNNVMLIFQVGE